MSETKPERPHESLHIPNLPVELTLLEDKFRKFDTYDEAMFKEYGQLYLGLSYKHPMRVLLSYTLRPSLLAEYEGNARRRAAYDMGVLIGGRVMNRLVREAGGSVRDAPTVSRGINNPAFQQLRTLDRTNGDAGLRVRLAQFFYVAELSSTGVTSRAATDSELHDKIVIAEHHMRPLVGSALTGHEHDPGHNDNLQIGTGDVLALYASAWALQRGDPVPQLETAPLV